MNMQQLVNLDKKMEIIAKKLVLTSKKGKIEPLLIKKTISILEKSNALKQLRDLGVDTSPEIGKEAVSALERLKAVKELEYLRYNAVPEVRKEAVSALERLKSI